MFAAQDVPVDLPEQQDPLGLRDPQGLRDLRVQFVPVDQLEVGPLCLLSSGYLNEVNHSNLKGQLCSCPYAMSVTVTYWGNLLKLFH